LVEHPPLTGRRLKAIIEAGARRLEADREQVNALNVFPVPDGDTGTNMCLTLAAALKEMDKVASSSLGETAKALSLGSLMGARGNSGVILSQLFRGMAKSLQEHRAATPLQVAWSLQEGVDTAYKAVMKPVEGTILTVAREMARAALQTAKRGEALDRVLEAAVARGREVLARTPDMLPVLKQAGVVDAGGMGLVCFMEGMLEGLRAADQASGQNRAAAGREAGRAADRKEAAEPAAASAGTEIRYAYDTQLLIRGTGLAVDLIRSQLESLGDSLLVVGDTRLVKVHVHTNEPHRALAACLLHGEIIEASIENMREQHEALKRGHAADLVREPGPPSAVTEGPTQSVSSVAADAPRDGLGVVAVASGQGLADIFRSLGANVVVSGGQTMNPSTEDLLNAVESLPSNEVLILPNNGNILMAAKQTAELSGKTVRVVPTKSVAQGIAALVALDRSLPLEKNQAKMEQAIQRVKSGEVTRAVRDSHFRDIHIHEGEFIGILNDEIVTTGPDSLSVLGELVSRMVDGHTEIVTVFCGEPVDDGEAAQAGERLRKACPDHEVEVHRGGQPLYHYLVSVE